MIWSFNIHLNMPILWDHPSWTYRQISRPEKGYFATHHQSFPLKDHFRNNCIWSRPNRNTLGRLISQSNLSNDDFVATFGSICYLVVGLNPHETTPKEPIKNITREVCYPEDQTLNTSKFSWKHYQSLGWSIML